MPTFPRMGLDPNSSKEEIIDYIVRLERKLREVLNYIDSDNMFEVGGWRVKPDVLQSKDGDVGMSTQDTAEDDIRFWAGDAIDGDPKFVVTKSGLMKAVGAILMSALGYPRVEINNETNLIKAMADANNYLSLNPTMGGAPALAFYVDSILTSYLNTTAGGTLLASFNSTDVTLQSSNNLNLSVPGKLRINTAEGYSGNVLYVKSVASDGMGGVVTSYGTLTFTRGILTGVT